MTPLQSAGPSVVFQETAFRRVYKQTQILQASNLKWMILQGCLILKLIKTIPTEKSKVLGNNLS